MPDPYRTPARPSGRSRHEPTEPARVRVPADVERPDQVIVGLTARQAAILTVTAVMLWLLWQVVHAFVPPMVFLGCAAPMLATGTVLALGRRDGLSLDRYALAALRHARSGHRQVHAPEGVLPVPGFARTLTPTSAGSPMPVPAQPVAQGIDAQGVIDLGRDGTSVIGAVGTVNFALRTPAEQEALIGAFAGWLNSLPGPVQILIRADRADLTPAISALRRDAPALPHPALEAAAGQHADFLTSLAATRDLLHRQVLLTHHHPAPVSKKPATDEASAHPSTGGRRWLTIRAPRTSPRSRTTAAPGRAEASGRGLHRRAEDAARMLAGADVAVTALDGPTASALLAASCSPITTASTTGPSEARSSQITRPAIAITNEPDGDTAGFTPAWLHLSAQSAQVAGEHVATFAVTGYPSEVAPGWLEPVLTYPGRLDVALHIEPVPPVIAADRLRKQRARLESTRRLSDSKGRLQDPELDAAADDATDLAYAVARGQTRLFKVGIYLTVHAATPTALADGVARVRALAESLLLRTEPATWRPVQGWATTLPLGVDALKLRRTLDTSALAAAFPFTSPDLPAADPVHPGRLSGVLYGVNATSPGLVVWDRWAQDNHNTVVLARSGSGKSYFTKLDVLRSLYTGVQVAVIDPENEYTALAGEVGGTVLPLGRPGIRLNPLDIPQPLTPSAATAMGANVGDGLTRRVLFAHTFLDVALGGLDPGERAALDQAVMGAYQQVGITTDPRTWARPAPLLADVAAHLAGARDPGTVEAAHRLASRMAPFVTGSWSGLFNGPTSVRPDGHLVVFCLKDLPDELKTLATLLTLDAIWQKVSDPSVPAAARRRRLVVVDEAWLLMRDPAGASFLFRMAKAARKYATGLSVITQDAADLLGTDLGQAVVANAATQVLMRQAPQAIDAIAEAFGLSAGDRQILLTAPQGRGLLLAGGSDRVAFQSIASPGEDALANSTPQSVTTHASPLSRNRVSVLGDPDDPYAVGEELS